MKLGPDKRLVIKETKHAEWIQFYGSNNCENTEVLEKGVIASLIWALTEPSHRPVFPRTLRNIGFNIGRIYLHSCCIYFTHCCRQLGGVRNHEL